MADNVHHLTAISLAVSSEKKRRRPRKSSIARMIAAAKKAGVSEISTPDGYTFKIGKQPSPETTNEWAGAFHGKH
jgi:hypothetical protein